MAMINNCNPVGPFNTPLNEDGNLVFTRDVYKQQVQQIQLNLL